MKIQSVVLPLKPTGIVSNDFKAEQFPVLFNQIDLDRTAWSSKKTQTCPDSSW